MRIEPVELRKLLGIHSMELKDALGRLREVE
jgi:hypothetical protein